MPEPIVMPRVSFEVTHLCNLHCDGCNHYANYTTKASVDLSTAEAWFTTWNQRIRPAAFKIVGGEPTLHPDLLEMIRLARRCWPDAALRLSTNGFFLDRHPDLQAVLDETDCMLILTVHSNQESYRTRIDPVIEQLNRWKAEGTSVMIHDGTRFWFKTYQGTGRSMLPFADGDPERSWKSCINKYCFMLHRNRLWKCPPTAYLGYVRDKFSLDDRPEWQPYLDYAGIAADASDADLRAFLSETAEAVCGMCPASPRNMPNKTV